MSRYSFMASVLQTAGVPKPRADINTFVVFVARRHGVSPAHIYGDSRRHEFVHPRQEVMWLASRAGHSTTAIGRELGRDHTTIIHGIKSYEKRRAENGYSAG